MLKQLKMTNIGPAPQMELAFGQRLNLLTGDNGLGKSFLLDIAWWALTRKWPAEVNAKLTSGKKALPSGAGQATISFSFAGKAKVENYESHFDRKEQAWTGRSGRPSNPGLVLYAQVDGSFAVWDPARNYWRKRGTIDVQDRPSSYVFSPQEVWDDLVGEDGKPLCNGLVRDWAGWQKENGEPYQNLQSVVAALSPSRDEKIVPGKLTRISLDDPRDIPTLKMPYGPEVPVLHASAGMKRIIALAYLLVWAWEEHKNASKLLDQDTTNQVIFLIDEIESHLHPRWQRRILSALVEVMNSLTRKAEVQIIAATHSPLILASVEPLFDPQKDAWFDLDYEDKGLSRKVVLTRRNFELHGDVSNWLTSEAFDLPSARSLDSEKLLEEAAALIARTDVASWEVNALHEKLGKALSPRDSFLFRWRAICEKKGFLK
ncbi:MAG: AAA family ATPase [Chloroflexi bacterium]|nr:AAA family ATPase [Chloroflexota bacterium]